MKELSSKRNAYSLSNVFEKQNPGFEGLTAEFYMCLWECVSLCCNPFKRLFKQRLSAWRNFALTKKGYSSPKKLSTGYPVHAV